MNKFKMLGGKEIDNIGEYVKSYLKLHPEVSIHIGTDSIKNKHFATVICFQFPQRGVHYVFRKFYLDPIDDIRLKILKEAEYTMELAEHLDPFLTSFKKKRMYESDSKIISLHVDVNPNECWGSNKAYREVTGWFIGTGYDVRTKPHAWAASSAADFLCK